MTRSPGLTPARFLAMLAMVLQVLLPVSMAQAQSQGVDVSRFICAPTGEVSPESRAAAEWIAKLLGEETPDEHSSDRHCPACTLSHAAALPDPITVAVPCASPRGQMSVRYRPGLIREAQGPPVGARGPPSDN